MKVSTENAPVNSGSRKLPPLTVVIRDQAELKAIHKAAAVEGKSADYIVRKSCRVHTAEVVSLSKGKRTPVKSGGVTVTLTGQLAASIRGAARDSRRTPEQIAENYCWQGCDRPQGDSGIIFIEVPSRLKVSLERMAKAAGYEDGVVDLALETMIEDEAILEGVARSLLGLIDMNHAQIAQLATVLIGEKLRHSARDGDKWTAKHVLGLEVEK